MKKKMLEKRMAAFLFRSISFSHISSKQPLSNAFCQQHGIHIILHYDKDEPYHKHSSLTVLGHSYFVST